MNIKSNIKAKLIRLTPAQTKSSHSAEPFVAKLLVGNDNFFSVRGSTDHHRQRPADEILSLQKVAGHILP